MDPGNTGVKDCLQDCCPLVAFQIPGPPPQASTPQINETADTWGKWSSKTDSYTFQLINLLNLRRDPLCTVYLKAL